MRSSKKRSRSNQNRPRSLGNIVNRVFDSSGPEGKVRGTPQQIIEKYQMLARDAQLSNDRVSAENFLQHAEHYTRMLAEAMKELAAEQEARQQQYQQNGAQQNGNGGGQQNQPRGDRPERQDRGERSDRPDRGERREFNRDFRAERDLGSEEQPVIADVIDLGTADETGLIETPESAADLRGTAEPAGAETRAPEDRPARRPRGPRKPRGESKPDGEPPQEAAE
ncbi:DUF4167 domain-containing protein [Tabrizicola flagellatus]|uniref:DUF4167 domain-containing protein n=1 Tax=Tabrizicola flagellatus TaxID=2593021 RepID=UPI0011F127EF|nr:DUF4167 domain-containing protein [Tabrizicola flagellatus]